LLTYVHVLVYQYVVLYFAWAGGLEAKKFCLFVCFVCFVGVEKFIKFPPDGKGILSKILYNAFMSNCQCMIDDRHQVKSSLDRYIH